MWSGVLCKFQAMGGQSQCSVQSYPRTQSSSGSSGDGRRGRTSRATGANKEKPALPALKAKWLWDSDMPVHICPFIQGGRGAHSCHEGAAPLNGAKWLTRPTGSAPEEGGRPWIHQGQPDHQGGTGRTQQHQLTQGEFFCTLTHSPLPLSPPHSLLTPLFFVLGLHYFPEHPMCRKHGLCSARDSHVYTRHHGWMGNRCFCPLKFT